uniref:Serine aminopeptidase S33 domain-containing protein n=1 Tax=Knipowitschia caucasica TaxID=637954 RepID=A0AAV2JAJ3_KNICA
MNMLRLLSLSLDKCGLQFSRDHLLLRDGAIVALDWVVGECEGGRRSSPPVLLLVPEHWGSLTPHLCSLCHSASALGFYVVLFHHRGTAGCPLTTTRLTEFGDPADLDQAVAYIHSRHPSSVLLAVSEGSGSGTLLSYLGEKGSGSRITAAAAFEVKMRPSSRASARQASAVALNTASSVISQ